MIDWITIVAILAFAITTYLTRILGYLLLRNKTLSPRMIKVMEAGPGCVMIAMIAPYFVAERPADLIAICITLLAATRLSLLPTVLIAIGSAALLRQFI